LSVLLLTAGLAACGGGKEAKEALQYQERPVEQLYNQAADLMDKRRWSESATAFEEVERQHPYTSWARRAMLMTAYVKYQSNNYDDSIEASRRFIQLHPGNEGAAYAYYLISVCYFEQILDVGRDQKTTQDALDALNEVIRRYPSSDYARDSRIKVDMTYDQLAGKEMEVGRFYLTRDQQIAAINRFRRVVEDKHLQTTSHTPEALHRLVEAYVSVGMTEDAQRSAAVLGHNFPGSEWYQRSYELLQSRGVSVVGEAEAKKRGWLGRTIDRVF
jgi:outer membrane protein assembly factor BamD